MFMNSFSHVKPKPSLPQNIPDSFKENGKDEIVWQVYLQHCSKKFPAGDGQRAVHSPMRKAGFVDEKVNPSATAILFAKARKPMAKRMQYPEFLRALAHMATIRGLDFEEAAGAFANKAILRPITNVGAPRDVIKTDDYEGNADEAEDEVGEVAHDEAAEEADAEEGKTSRIQEVRRRARSVRLPRQKWRTRKDVAGGREDQTSTLEEGGETRGHEQLGHEGRNRRRRTVCCAQEHGGGIWQADVHSGSVQQVRC